MWSQSQGRFLSKVDDDALLRLDWLDKLRTAHAANPEFGVVGCWRFLESDFDEDICSHKLRSFAEGPRLLQNLWVEGSGYLMKRECVDRLGLLSPNQGFTDYCIQIAKQGWINGWLYPFILQEDLDDPRSPNALVKTDEDLQARLPLGAIKQGITTLDAWANRRHVAAIEVQEATLNPLYYSGWRPRARRLIAKLAVWRRVKPRPKWNPNW